MLAMALNHRCAPEKKKKTRKEKPSIVGVVSRSVLPNQGSYPPIYRNEVTLKRPSASWVSIGLTPAILTP
jgi:hypothetical protein